MKRTFEEVADLLVELYEEDFGGKSKGRYKISRNDLAAISGRAQIKQGAVDQISELLADEHGLLMIDLGNEFPITKISILRNYRSVTAKLIKKHTPAMSEED
jgi:hypothetical protein